MTGSKTGFKTQYANKGSALRTQLRSKHMWSLLDHGPNLVVDVVQDKTDPITQWVLEFLLQKVQNNQRKIIKLGLTDIIYAVKFSGVTRTSGAFRQT